MKNGRPYTNENGVSDSKLIYTLSDTEVALVSSWIKDNIRHANGNFTGRTSNGLKHLLQQDCGVHLTNNQFKHAMLLAGYAPIDADELNWEFNIMLTKDIIENPSPFFNWLVEYTDEDSMIGDFARDVMIDKAFPAMADYWVVRRYRTKSYI